jgi:hypothetical protein
MSQIVAMEFDLTSTAGPHCYHYVYIKGHPLRRPTSGIGLSPDGV